MMFDQMGTGLRNALQRLRQRGVITESDINEALETIKLTLLEADVALPVLRDFLEHVRKRSLGEKVLRAVAPGQMVAAIVHETLIESLGGESGCAPELPVGPAPVPILLVGLQGVGKTTSAAKLAHHWQQCTGKRALLASLDPRRPAAHSQLATLSERIGAPCLSFEQGETPDITAQRAMQMARLDGRDFVILDSAGRHMLDDALMAELKQIESAVSPREVLLVADAMTGQEAVTIAHTFDNAIHVTGIMLTRTDGDARGGAALSMHATIGRPIRWLGRGEGIEDLEAFDARRVADRLLGMGDVIGLVEAARAAAHEEENAQLASRMSSGRFDLEDMLTQLRQVQRMGGLARLADMIPNLPGLKSKLGGLPDKNLLKRQEAIILAMTPIERRQIRLLGAARKRRIAAGSGVSLRDVNQLIKQFQKMQSVMKSLGKRKGKLPLGLANLAEDQLPTLPRH